MTFYEFINYTYFKKTVKPQKSYLPTTNISIFTPLLHKDVVESTACPHQKAVSTFLPPAQAPPKLPARRVLQLGERGFCPGGRASRFRVEATGPEGTAGHYF